MLENHFGDRDTFVFRSDPHLFLLNGFNVVDLNNIEEEDLRKIFKITDYDMARLVSALDVKFENLISEDIVETIQSIIYITREKFK